MDRVNDQPGTAGTEANGAPDGGSSARRYGSFPILGHGRRMGPTEILIGGRRAVEDDDDDADIGGLAAYLARGAITERHWLSPLS